MTQTVPGVAVLGPGLTGLTLGYRVLNLDGTTYAAFSTTDVAETSVLGTYRKASGIVCPDAGGYVVWGTVATDYAEATVESLDANTVKVSGTAQTAGDIVGLLGNIANVSSPSFAAPASYTLTTGNQTGGTYANVDSDNDVYHVLTDDAGTLSLIYDFVLAPDEQANSALWRGRWNNTNDTLLFEIYDWVGPGWVTWFTRVGVAGTTAAADFTQETNLVGKYTGTGTNAGKVRVRITGSGLSSMTLSTDQLIVGKTSRAGGITNGSTITLAATTNNANYVGNNWILDLGGQDISGCYFYGAKQVTGISSASTGVTFENCDFGAATVPPGKYINCGFGLASGTLTAASAGEYILRSCYSCVPGAGTPVFDWATGTGTIRVNGRGWHGGSSHTIDGDNTISWEVNGGGGQTFAGGGTVELRGNFRQATFTGHAAGKTSQIASSGCGPIAINGSGGTVNIFGPTGTITDNSSAAVTITSTQALNLANINAEADTALANYDPPTNTEFEARTLPSADYVVTTDTLAAVTAVGSVSGAVGSVTGDVGGKVLGGGATVISGTGARVVDASGNDVATSANQTTILNRLGAWTGSGVNTLLGAFKALLSKAASLPSDITGTGDPATDSVEALAEAIAEIPTNPYTGTPPTTSDIVTALEANGTKLDHIWETTEDDGGVRRFTANALEEAPTGGSLTASDVADAVWDELSTGHTDAGKAGAQLWTDIDDIKAQTDLITTGTSLTLVSAIDGGAITLTIGATFAAQVSGLTIAASWTKYDFSLKNSADDTDAQALLRIRVTNPAAAATDGVQWVEGAPSTVAQRTLGSLTVTQAAGTIDIAATAALTAALSSHAALVWDLKEHTASAITVRATGTAKVQHTPTWAVT